MKAPGFEYHRAKDLAEALDLLATKENARILAGGQSLVVMMNMRYIFPDHLIDINGLSELEYISAESGRIRIGAVTRQRSMETSEDLRRACPIFSEALAHIGHRQTRNRGTFGGSLCHLDPSAELPTLALLYDAQIHVASSRGRRTMAAQEFLRGFMSPALETDEMLLGAEWTAWPVSSGYAFKEHSRRHGDFAIASAACLIEADEERRSIKRAALAVGGLTDRPIRLDRAEAQLRGAEPSVEAFNAAAQTCDDFEAAADIHARAGYRAALAQALVRRALSSAWKRATTLGDEAR